MVWAGYAREAAHFDRKMVFNWHRNVDTRLLFVRCSPPSHAVTNPAKKFKSGIFSAILTPFLVESYKLVGLDSESKHPGFFSAGGWKLRVNAFWFGALMVSVIAALLAIHCKQWLDGYTVNFVEQIRSRETYRVGCLLRLTFSPLRMSITIACTELVSSASMCVTPHSILPRPACESLILCIVAAIRGSPKIPCGRSDRLSPYAVICSTASIRCRPRRIPLAP
jgi:hypothetical protein